jgi:hypothetical protein
VACPKTTNHQLPGAIYLLSPLSSAPPSPLATMTPPYKTERMLDLQNKIIGLAKNEHHQTGNRAVIHWGAMLKIFQDKAYSMKSNANALFKNINR